MRFLVQHQAALSDSALQMPEVDYASDLSRGGLFISTRKPMVAKDTLHVQFAPRKDAQLISAFCRVKEVRPDGVAAEFLALDAEAEQLIASALSA